MVLVNNWTYSAGELLALLLQDEKRSIILGGRTAGAEAAVVEVEDLNGATLTFGRHRIRDANGNGFQGKGILPDLEIPLPLDLVHNRGFWTAAEMVGKQRLRSALEFLEGTPAGMGIVPLPASYPRETLLKESAR